MITLTSMARSIDCLPPAKPLSKPFVPLDTQTIHHGSTAPLSTSATTPIVPAVNHPQTYLAAPCTIPSRLLNALR